MEYSTLSVLESVAYDIIKIDRHFTKNMGSKNSDIIIDMIRKLSQHNNKRCVIEGIETEDQLITLMKRGFTEFQGFYFSKPLNPKEIREYFFKPFED